MAGHEAPPFWYQKPGLISFALRPIAAIYGYVATRRMDKANPVKLDAPAICVGNLTVGGTGKTPTAIELAKIAIKQKYKPGFVSRGYGGIHVKPHLVDVETDTSSAVGDEPLLLARTAPTVVGMNRAANARLLLEQGRNLIIMDDGFQSRSLYFDYGLLVVDARRGIGNGRVLPAGPLRAPLKHQMRHATSILRIGNGDAGDTAIRALARAGKPLMIAQLKPANTKALKGKQVFAFTGIGDPQKFYETLSQCGCLLAATRSFGDHHAFTNAEATQLLEKAAAENLTLVTTEKDLVRLTHKSGPLAELRQNVQALPVKLAFDVKGDGEAIINNAVNTFEQRKIAGDQ